MYLPEEQFCMNKPVEVLPESSAKDDSTEACCVESETCSPQPTIRATGLVIAACAENVSVASASPTPDAGKSPVVYYDDQPGIPIPSSSIDRYNIDCTQERKAEWDKYCRGNAWKVGKKAGNPAAHNFRRGTSETLPEDAVKKWVKPMLTPLELATLPCKLKEDERGNKHKCYSIKGLLVFLHKRSSELGIDIVASIRLQDEPLRGPLRLRRYDPPLRSYRRTPKDPSINSIIFDNEVLPANVDTISVNDASLLYDIPRVRLMALHAWHPKLDILTVAIIALELHDGFHAHNNKIVERRRKTIQNLQEARFTSEGVYFCGPHAGKFCERLLNPQSPVAIGLGENGADITNRHLYVKQYLPVGCVVVRDENGALKPGYWFHGSPNYPLDEVRDLTLLVSTK